MSRPYVLVFTTSSLDGRIAGENVSGVLSCDEDFRLQHMLRAWADGVMVGANTVIRDDPRLTVRLVPGRSPARIVVDAKLRTPVSARVYRESGRRILVTSNRRSDEELAPYRESGVEVIRVPEDPRGLLDLREALRDLYEIGIRKLMVEGGGILIYTLLASGLVDELRVTIAPTVIGAGVSLANPPVKGGEAEIWAKLRLKETRILCGHWVHLVYSVTEPRIELY